MVLAPVRLRRPVAAPGACPPVVLRHRGRLMCIRCGISASETVIVCRRTRNVVRRSGGHGVGRRIQARITRSPGRRRPWHVTASRGVRRHRDPRRLAAASSQIFCAHPVIRFRRAAVPQRCRLIAFDASHSRRRTGIGYDAASECRSRRCTAALGTAASQHRLVRGIGIDATHQCCSA